MNAWGIELLPDDALKHAMALVLQQQPRTAVLREREGEETHTLPFMNEQQRAGRGSKTISGRRHN